MKYKGEAISRIGKTIVIPQINMEIDIHTYPVGVTRRFDSFYPEPRPPVSVTVDAKTGKQTEITKWNDTEFLKRSREYAHYKTMFMLWLGIKDASNIEFETKEVNSVETIKAFEQEIIDSGLAEGDIGYILSQIAQLSNLNIKEITDTKEVF